MDSAGYFISPNELWALIGTDRAPQIVYTRKRALRRCFEAVALRNLERHNWPAKAA